MGIFGRGARKPPADVSDLRLANDVGGLVRALESPSATVVKDAAAAIGNVFRCEPDPARAEASRAGPALLRALDRMSSVMARPADPSAIVDTVDAGSAAWSVIDALGQIGAAESAGALEALLTDPTADPHARERAAIALGAIGSPSSVRALVSVLDEPRISRPVVLTGAADDLATAAAQGLAGLGEVGIEQLVTRLATGAATAPVALAALRSVPPDRAGGERARQAVAEADHRSAVAARVERAERSAHVAAMRAGWAREHPQAAALAERLGHPDWLVEGGSLRPTEYREAVERCRSLGVPIEEFEEVVDDEMSDVWATVIVDDVPVLLDGGRRFRDVLY